ncbi:MAG: 50S ribosome-binding GTPase, partial [Planctomycetes bacterium]|nr:50S ribosome-binding GTPase [Planctomycetota bacterium]
RTAALLATLPAAAPGGEVLLLGAANAGKSSLANALAGAETLLVDAVPGTTRDLVRVELAAAADADTAGTVALWDAPGDLEAPAAWDATALALRDRLAGRAAAALAVLDATAPRWPRVGAEFALPWLAVVFTKCDLLPLGAPPPRPPVGAPAGLAVVTTSARDGRGLPDLRALLASAARAGAVDAGGPLRTRLGAVAAAIERARAVVDDAPELAAVELAAALAALDGIAGSHSPEALLDRIYGRFCLGK